MTPYCIASEMISATLPNLIWANILTASCFACFIVNTANYFCVIIVAREKSRLVPPNAIPIRNPASLPNAVIETPPVITVVVTWPVSITLVIVLNRVIFFVNLSGASISSSKYASISIDVLSDMFVALVES